MPRKTTVPGRKPGRPAGSVAAAKPPTKPAVPQSSPATNTVIAAMTEYGYQLQQGVEFFQKLIDGYATLEAMVRASNGTAAASKIPDTSAMTTKELRQLVNEYDLDVDLDEYDEIEEKRIVVGTALTKATTKPAPARHPVKDEDDDLDGDDDDSSATVDFSRMSEKALKQFVDDHELDMIDVDSYDDVEDLRDAVEAAYLDQQAAGDDDGDEPATAAAADDETAALWD